MVTLLDSLDNLIFGNLEDLQKQISEMAEILEIFVKYWYSRPPKTKSTMVTTKLKIAFSMLKFCLDEVQVVEGKENYQIIACKLKLLYYLRSFYMMNHSKVLVLPRKNTLSYEEPQRKWIEITNHWQKYQKMWTKIRMNKDCSEGCEMIMRICQSSLEGL